MTVAADLDGTDTTEPAPASGASIEAPLRGDGTPYRYEMLYAGMTRRAYADDPDDLIEHLAPGYTAQGHAEQWVTRLALAARGQVLAQAEANSSAMFDSLTVAQQMLLSGSRHEPVIVPDWDCPIPLVLIRTDYAPAGKAPLPQSRDGMPANVIWIDPSDEWSLLESLDAVDVIAVHEAAPSPEPDPAQ